LADDKDSIGREPAGSVPAAPETGTTSAPAAGVITPTANRTRRVVIAAAIVVLIVGNLIDLIGFTWFGTKSDLAVKASGGLFWITAAALMVSVYDTIAARAGRFVIASTGNETGLIDRIKDWTERHYAAVGVIGLVLGAILGHVFWQPY
jgi:hypothetical protein